MRSTTAGGARKKIQQTKRNAVLMEFFNPQLSAVHKKNDIDEVKRSLQKLSAVSFPTISIVKKAGASSHSIDSNDGNSMSEGLFDSNDSDSAGDIESASKRAPQRSKSKAGLRSVAAEEQKEDGAPRCAERCYFCSSSRLVMVPHCDFCGRSQRRVVSVKESTSPVLVVVQKIARAHPDASPLQFMDLLMKHYHIHR
jgi:hypothetical protein